MKILIVLALIVVGFFVLIFLAGFIIAMLTGSEKKMKGWAKEFLEGNLSVEEKEALDGIWKAFQAGKTEVAEELLNSLSPQEVAKLKKICSPDIRPVQFSSGAAGDNLTWDVWFNEAKEKGFSETSSYIIAGIGLNGYK